jgi:hypothetical protein
MDIAECWKVCESKRERERDRKGWGVSPTYDTHSMLTRTTKPSAAARPSIAEKGGSGVYFDYDTT